MVSSEIEALSARFDVSRETIDKLQAYVSLMLKWQSKINIIGPSTAEQVWQRHIADSLQLTSFIEKLVHRGPISVLDLGTGAGLPGIPLALHLAQKSKSFVHLVDSNSKKAAFLQEATRLTEIEAEIYCRRIENIDASQVSPAPSIVVSRALAPLDQLSAWVCPWIERGAVGVFLKGRSVEKELAATDPSRRLVYKVVQSELNSESAIVVVEARG
ncbi:MAG: 16S rRNA (guanine(527)-N(7))-methyltransferase RsmG [Rhodobacteraceae bacterium]|nr:16S rRNA (guanine(527)-N(7))-methyltransferase RsmG [Paracoccaceae bacterium]